MSPLGVCEAFRHDDFKRNKGKLALVILLSAKLK